MANLFSRLLKGQRTGMDTAVVGKKEEPAKNLSLANIKAAVFFDGTLNNRANTRIRQATQKELEERVVQAQADVQQASGAQLDALTAQKQAETAVDEANMAHVRAPSGPERATAAQALRGVEEAAKPARQRRQQADEELAGTKRALAAAERTQKKYRDAVNGKSGANYFSNVSILQEMNLIEDRTTKVSVYVEGIGTDDGEEDSSLGYAFGAGPTGVPAKVSKGILLLREAITKALEDSEKQLGTLQVEAFGFSRGAVAARHFVSRTTAQFFPERITLCREVSLEPDKLTVNFVGLFDSVSSYGGEQHQTMLGQAINNKLKQSFNNDVAELRLNLAGVPIRVVHFTAADEYRKNFASTSIDSTLRAAEGKGLEVALPGVHSDIGGGYEESALETRNIAAQYRQGLLDEGWYAKDELEATHGGWNVGRRVLTHHYQFVALAMMVELAKKDGVMFKPFVDEFKDFVIPPDLQGVHAELWKQVQAARGQAKRVPIALPAGYEWVRRQYLHRSAIAGELSIAGFTMSGRYDEQELPDREIISDLA